MRQDEIKYRGMIDNCIETIDAGLQQLQHGTYNSNRGTMRELKKQLGILSTANRKREAEMDEMRKRLNERN